MISIISESSYEESKKESFTGEGDNSGEASSKEGAISSPGEAEEEILLTTSEEILSSKENIDVRALLDKVQDMRSEFLKREGQVATLEGTKTVFDFTREKSRQLAQQRGEVQKADLIEMVSEVLKIQPVLLLDWVATDSDRSRSYRLTVSIAADDRAQGQRADFSLLVRARPEGLR